VFYHYAMQVQLPMTDAEFDTLFVKSMRLFLANVQQQTCPGIQTNVDIGAGFNEPFLLLGVGVLAMGEDLSFCQEGTLISDATNEAIIAGSVAPVTTGCAPVPANPDFAETPAKIWYGGPTWRLINKFFQLKRFVLRVGRCEIINESLFELGMLYTPPQFLGAGDSCVPTMPFIRETNDTLNAKTLGSKFVPANTTVNAEGGSVSCAPNAPVTYGHPVIHNLANRIFCLPQPLLITPYTRVDIEFQTVDNDCCLIPAARAAAQLRCETPVEDWPLLTDAGGPAQVCTVPGGCMTLGIILKGYVCLPQAVADYLMNYLTCGSAYETLYRDSSYMAGVINKFGLAGRDNLKGLVGGLQGTGALSPQD
jgi:hypothetical protein